MAHCPWYIPTAISSQSQKPAPFMSYSATTSPDVASIANILDKRISELLLRHVRIDEVARFFLGFQLLPLFFLKLSKSERENDVAEKGVISLN